MIGCFFDISQRKAQEQKQREHQEKYERLLKLEVANQTIAAIAHELNQPLTAAASFADAAHRFLHKSKPDQNKSNYALEQCVQQVDRAGQVVHELFNFLHSGEIITKPLDLNAIVSRVVKTIKEDDSLKGFKIELNLADDLDNINANELQLEKVLLILIRNAIEAMSDAAMNKGEIVVKITTSADQTSALVCVYDTGPGLSSEMIQHIFQPFYTTKSDGLGMGLAIARSLIEYQGGQLWYQANEGKRGACFHLTLPFSSE